MLDELGKALQNQRERLGMTLEDVENQTKIRKRYLEALEMGNWSVLPGEVYARGFVRSYAEYLGLDGGRLLAEYVDKAVSLEPSADPLHGVSSAPPISPSSSPSPSPSTLPGVDMVSRNREQREPTHPLGARSKRGTSMARPTRSRRGGRGLLGQAGAVALALAVLGGAWWLLSYHGNSRAVSGPPNGVVGNQGVSTTNKASGNGLSSTRPTGNVVGNGTNSVNNSAANTSGGNLASAVKVTALPFQNGTQVFDVSSSQPLSVVLNADKGTCWLKVTADGQVIDGNDTVVQGQSRTWSAQRSLQVYMGNAPVVTMSVNGQLVQLPQTGSGVMTVVFQKTQS